MFLFRLQILRGWGKDKAWFFISIRSSFLSSMLAEKTCSQMHSKTTLQAEKTGKRIQSLLVHNPKIQAKGEFSILTVLDVMERAVWPDFEDHLQTTAFISWIAVSDAKDDPADSDTVYNATLGQKREDRSFEEDLHQAWLVSFRLSVYHSRWFRLSKVGSES